MGEIVGVGLVSHVPTIMLPEHERRELNEGSEISLVPGIQRLRAAALLPARADTVIVLDSHWASTVEFLVASHERRAGHYTSDELPRGMSAIPYDVPGDPALAKAIEREVVAAGSWCTAIDDPHLPIHYPTVNLLHYLQGAERWVSVSLAQTGETEDFLLLGEAIGRAVAAEPDRRVVVLASGGMSHRFWPLRQIRAHESSNPEHIRSIEARAADEQRLEWMDEGRHDRIIDGMGDYLRFHPEGRFGHYLAMIAAIGGTQSRARAERFSDYENSVGTGQVHVWFPRPDAGWPRLIEVA